jgi:diguanylate cyclase (GGDEF)-like protein
MLIDRPWTATQLQSNLKQVLCPTVCFRIHHLLRRNAADYTDIAAVAMGDPYLSAKIVAMANFTQGPGKPAILSLQRALQVLGTRHTHMLVMSVMLAGPLLECPARQANLELRRWVLALGAAGEWIGLHDTTDRPADRPGSDYLDDCMIAGLMLGLGVLVLHAGLGPEYNRLLGSPPSVLQLREAEAATLQATHDQVTAWALEAMHCPPELGTWFDGHSEQDGSLRRRAVETLAAMIADLDRDQADTWLADGLPRLGIDPSSLFGPELSKLRRRVADLAAVFAIDVGNLGLEDHPAELLREAGATMEALLADKLVTNESASAALHHETITAIAAEVAARHADLDPLTGVCNRRGLDQWLRDHREHPGSVGLLMVDLDYFKEVNDTWGHAAGDQVLIHTARMLQETHPCPLVVARLGGDEFVAVYPTSTFHDLRALTDELLAALARKPVGDRPSVTVSAGGALKNAQELFRHWREALAAVDSLLYRAKHAGRSRALLEGEPAGNR